MVELLDEELPQDAAGARDLAHVRGAVELCGVRVRYPGAHPRRAARAPRCGSSRARWSPWSARAAPASRRSPGCSPGTSRRLDGAVRIDGHDLRDLTSRSVRARRDAGAAGDRAAGRDHRREHRVRPPRRRPDRDRGGRPPRGRRRLRARARRRATTPGSASAAAASRAGSASGSPSPGPCCATRRCSSSTNPRPASTSTPRAGCSTRWRGTGPVAPSSWPPTTRSVLEYVDRVVHLEDAGATGDPSPAAPGGVTAVTVTGQEPLVVPVGAEVLPGYRVEALLARGGRVDTYDVDQPRARLPGGGEGRAPRPARRAHGCARRCRRGRAAHHARPPAPGPRLRGGQRARRPAVVLETLPGATLAALLDDRPLGVADAALLGRQLVSVLGYLHRHGWLHLDVKPENVVVQEGRAVLIDLGAAPPGPDRFERGRRHRGGYAAPEQDAGGTVDRLPPTSGASVPRSARASPEWSRDAVPTSPGSRRRCARWSPAACSRTRSGGPRWTRCAPGSTS